MRWSYWEAFTGFKIKEENDEDIFEETCKMQVLWEADCMDTDKGRKKYAM